MRPWSSPAPGRTGRPTVIVTVLALTSAVADTKRGARGDAGGGGIVEGGGTVDVAAVASVGVVVEMGSTSVVAVELPAAVWETTVPRFAASPQLRSPSAPSAQTRTDH